MLTKIYIFPLPGLIAEVILYSEGFESSKNLAQKMVQMYKLCSEQLSQQDHYDFGLYSDIHPRHLLMNLYSIANSKIVFQFGVYNVAVRYKTHLKLTI